MCVCSFHIIEETLLFGEILHTDTKVSDGSKWCFLALFLGFRKCPAAFKAFGAKLKLSTRCP